MHDLTTKIRDLIEDSEDELHLRIEDLESELNVANRKIRQLEEENEAILDEYSWLEDENTLLVEVVNSFAH